MSGNESDDFPEEKPRQQNPEEIRLNAKLDQNLAKFRDELKRFTDRVLNDTVILMLLCQLWHAVIEQGDKETFDDPEDDSSVPGDSE